MNLGRRAVLAAGLAATALPAQAAGPLATVAIDRSQSGWWRERHAAKLRELKAGPVELVFLGDSILHNFERVGPPAYYDYQPVWQRFYGDRHAVNLGFKGDATSHLLWRMTHGELDGIAPKVAVVLIGANNLGRVHWPTADNVAGITAVVDTTRKRLPKTHIVLLGILPSDRSPWASQTTLEVNAGLAARYGGGGVAGVSYLDVGKGLLRDGRADHALYYDPLLSPPEPTLHPTPEGMTRIARAMEPTLARLLGDKMHG